MFVLAGGWYVLLRDDSGDSAAKTVPAPAVVSTPKQVKDILTATAKQTRTKVVVRRGTDAGSTRLVDTAERVVARSLYDKVHYRDLQFGDDVYSYDDERSCYLHAKQPKSVPVSSPTSNLLPAGRSGLTYKVSEAGGKTTVVWSYAPDGKTKPTATGTVVADSDTHLMLSASGGTGVFERTAITYGDAVAMPRKPGNLCKSRG